MPTALLIIDVQTLLCSGEPRVHDVERVIGRINHVARKARSANALVVIIHHETQGGDMDYGSENWKLAALLERHDTDVVIRKAASDAFLRTNLHDLLTSHSITDLIICGLQSEFCVDSTVRRAMALGYPVALVADGHSTFDTDVLSAAQISAHHNKTLASLASYGPRTRAVPAADIAIEG
jgi:nicotinamidase-related amidase